MEMFSAALAEADQSLIIIEMLLGVVYGNVLCSTRRC